MIVHAAHQLRVGHDQAVCLSEVAEVFDIIVVNFDIVAPLIAKQFEVLLLRFGAPDETSTMTPIKVQEVFVTDIHERFASVEASLNIRVVCLNFEDVKQFSFISYEVASVSRSHGEDAITLRKVLKLVK